MPQQMTVDEFAARRANEDDLNRPLPIMGKPLGERQMETLLKPDLPVKKGPLEKLWIFSGEATRHVQLTNIPTEADKRRFDRNVNDILRVATWDADDYLDLLQAKFLVTKVLAAKSIGYTRMPRERDALNESRITQTIRDDRPPIPKDNGGLFGFLRRG